jgi:hypothetical protein
MVLGQGMTVVIALNKPQFGDPIGTMTDGNFGRIIAGGGERRLQPGVRAAFQRAA